MELSVGADRKFHRQWTPNGFLSDSQPHSRSCRPFCDTTTPIPYPNITLVFPLACCLLSCVAYVDLSLFFFSLFSISIWTSFVFILPFSCGYYAASLLSVSAATRLDTRYFEVCTLIRTYADVTFLFLSEVHDLFQLCVLSSVFICFPPEVIFRSRVIGACPVTTDCIVAMLSLIHI